MVNKLKVSCCSIILLIMLSACSSSSPVAGQSESFKKITDGTLMEEVASVLLRNEFDIWEGTPYRFGGTNKQGIDCSALIQKIYLSSFNLKLPRTTKRQSRQGYLINKSKLQVGDLVFFKTSLTDNHVGIFIGNGLFLHASSSQGVMISVLNNSYWRSKYWQSRRILN
ncbi:NLP/P60 protein [Psychromonas ingrahamii 37]|uniref:NLP/P60 protein n=1 Tax=Psychromonas ingrahamii (strain DSM 17664 / CCUG 51855 / 37) TaxID=357804 RepID=A1STI4_PSYIN|nr:NlpC/P60 family protein [Psychromonas ingrahamii]ABM02799.1 NLP/P60 protein [Psychromonas ingrahamii 37]